MRKVGALDQLMNCRKSLEKETMKLVIIYCEGGAIYASVLIAEKLCCKTIISNLRPELHSIFTEKKIDFIKFSKKIRIYLFQKHV
jgi:hypothetical protein